MLSHELSFKTGGLRAAWAPGLCVHEAGWALAEAWGVLSAGTARPGIPFVTPPEVQPGAPLPCLPSGGAHYAGCSLSPWAGLSPGPSVPSLRTERRAGCSRGQGLPMGTEGRTSPGESPAPATGEPDGVAAPPPRMVRVMNCITPEKSSLHHYVLHFSLQNTGDLINLLVDVAAERYISGCIYISFSVIVYLNCKFS